MVNKEQGELFAQEGESQVEVFKKQEVRKVFHEKEWLFSVKDVLEVLTESTDGNRYSRGLRKKDPGLDDSWSEITKTLPFATEGGKQNTTFFNIEGIFRVMQSVPSKNAEPFKKWLAKVGFERIQELENPEIALKRAMAIYKAKGYDDAWIDARIPNKAARVKLEEEWKKRGIEKGVEYAILTNSISQETFGIDTKEHKHIKGLKTQNLRDNMTPIELTLTTLAEQATVQIAQARDAQGFRQNEYAAKSGGQIAGNARKDIESITGEEVISNTNYLTEQQRKNNSLQDGKGAKVIDKVINKKEKK